MSLIISVPKSSHTCVSQHEWVCGHEVCWVSSCVNPHPELRPPPPHGPQNMGIALGPTAVPSRSPVVDGRPTVWRSSPPLSTHTHVHTRESLPQSALALMLHA